MAKKYSSLRPNADRTKLLFIFAGGMIGYDPREGRHVSWERYRTTSSLFDRLPDVDGITVPGCSTEFSNDGIWLKTADIVRERYDDYDGFVIADEVFSLPYHASALSYMIRDPGKPIILTGAMSTHIGSSLPLADSLTHSLRSLYWAGRKGQDGSQVGEISVFFRDRLVQGNQARFIRMNPDVRFTFLANSRECDDALNWDFIDYMAVQPGLVRPPGALKKNPRFNLNLGTDNMMPLDCSPNGAILSYRYYTQIIEQPLVRAILVKTFSRFHLATRDKTFPFLRRLRDFAHAGGIVCMVCDGSDVSDPDGLYFDYGSGPDRLYQGMCPIVNLTAEAAWAKLAFAMGQKTWSRHQRMQFLMQPQANDGAINPSCGASHPFGGGSKVRYYKPRCAGTDRAVPR